MTAMRDLLVHAHDESASRHAVALAAAFADAHGARLTLLLAAAPTQAGMGLSAEAASLAQQLAQAQRQSLRATGERLLAAVQPPPGVPITLQIADGDPVEVLLARSRTTDLLIMSQRDPAGEGGLKAGQAARLLVGAACPVLTVPHIGWPTDGLAAAAPGMLQSALVAWSGTRESARALHDALPLLARAARIELVGLAGTADGEAQACRAGLQAVADHLAAHGLAATLSVLHRGEPSLGERMRRAWVPDVAVAEALLSHAAHIQADFIVMGGYGHARAWELVLGGVTRTMLATMTVPVLMSH